MSRSKRLLSGSGLNVFAVVSALVMTGVPQAFAGGESSGGGDYLGLELVDFVEAEGMTRIDARELPAYEKDVRPVLQRLATHSPDFAMALQRGLSAKRWYFEERELVPPTDAGVVAVRVDGKLRRVAFQDEEHVRIQQELFRAGSSKTQAGLIVHELVRNLAIESNRKIKESSIREITRSVFNGDIDPSELHEKLLKYGFGNTMSSEKRERLVRALSEFDEEVCKADLGRYFNGKGDPNSLSQRIIHAYGELSRAELYTYPLGLDEKGARKLVHEIADLSETSLVAAMRDWRGSFKRADLDRLHKDAEKVCGIVAPLVKSPEELALRKVEQGIREILYVNRGAPASTYIAEVQVKPGAASGERALASPQKPTSAQAK